MIGASCGIGQLGEEEGEREASATRVPADRKWR